MPFTGRLGTPNSQLGNIVLGIVDSFGLGTFGFTAHQIGARKVRIVFDVPVTDSALPVGMYFMSSLAPPGTAIVPAILSVEFYDETRRSVVLNLSLSLTSGTAYSVQVFGVEDAAGEGVSGAARNFTANVIDPPHVLGAYLSRRGCVDIVFDRSVGPTSPAATATIRDSNGGGGVAMTLQVWSSELVLPESSLRFALPPGMAAANSYAIDFSGVVDQSFNSATGSTDLDLVLRSPLPYDYTKITQLQIIDAYVADVSNDFIMTGTVRVYFNGPVGDARTQTNWSVTQQGPHVHTDTVDLITAPDAIDEPTFVTLMNDFKAKFNAHLVAAGIHVNNDPTDTVTSPDAVDTDSGIDILNEGQLKVLSHFVASGVHVYNDLYNTFGFLSVPHGQLGFAVAVMNQNLKPAYNGHLAPIYSVPFSIRYPFQIGPEILDRTQLSASTDLFPQVFPAETPYTYYADLHLVMNSNEIPVTIAATLTSDDAGSMTNPGDYTGSIIARAVNTQVTQIFDQEVVDESAALFFDREPLLDSSSSVKLLDSSGNIVESNSVRVSATLPGVMWAFNQLAFAFSQHVSGFPNTGAGHQNIDFMNNPVYAVSPTLEDAIISVNSFVINLNNHMSSNFYHFQSDFDIVQAPIASDMDTLVALVAEIRKKFLAHNIKLGVHSAPGWRIYSARLFDGIIIETDSMIDSMTYTFSANFKDVYHDNSDGDLTPGTFDGRHLGADHHHQVSIQFPIEGVASTPSLASALPRPGIVDTDAGVRLEADTVEVYFSKPMYQVPLDSSNLVLTGGSIVVKEMSWRDPQVVSIRVTSMEPISYTLQAVGLTDTAGNAVIP